MSFAAEVDRKLSTGAISRALDSDGVGREPPGPYFAVQFTRRRQI